MEERVGGGRARIVSRRLEWPYAADLSSAESRAHSQRTARESIPRGEGSRAHPLLRRGPATAETGLLRRRPALQPELARALFRARHPRWSGDRQAADMVAQYGREG